MTTAEAEEQGRRRLYSWDTRELTPVFLLVKALDKMGRIGWEDC